MSRAPPPRAVAVAGGERAWPVFCHLIHIITGVTPFDGGGKLIASVTVLSASVSPSSGILRYLSPFPSQPYICSPPSVQISVFRNRSREKPHLSCLLASPQSRSPSSATAPKRNHISAAFWLPRPVPLRARSSGRAGASGTLARLRTLHGVCSD